MNNVIITDKNERKAEAVLKWYCPSKSVINGLKGKFNIHIDEFGNVLRVKAVVMTQMPGSVALQLFSVKLMQNYCGCLGVGSDVGGHQNDI